MHDLREARKSATALAQYTRRFRDGLLEDEASLNGVMMAALRCFRSIPQSRDEVGAATDIYAGLQSEVSLLRFSKCLLNVGCSEGVMLLALVHLAGPDPRPRVAQVLFYRTRFCISPFREPQPDQHSGLSAG